MQQVVVIGAAVASALMLVVGGFILMAPFLAALPGAFAAVGTVVGVVSGVLAGPLVLAIGAVVAAGALLVAAWRNNWGGIQEKTAAVWVFLQGAFSGLVAWLSTNIPAAIATVVGWWQGTLYPAFQTVAGFISTYVIPLVSALANVFTAVLGKAIEASVGLWQNVLHPALMAVAAMVEARLTPALGWLTDNVLTPLGAVISSVVGPALAWFNTSVVIPLSASLGAMGAIFQGIVAYIRAFGDTIRNLDLPDWLTPGSPTPLETGLYGVLGAMDKLSRTSMPAFLAGGLPASAFNGTTGGGGSGAPANMGLTVNLVQGPDGRYSVDTSGQSGIGHLRVALNQVATT